jgi:hypothetical protein
MRTGPALVNALVRAFRYRRMPDEGRYALISELLAAEKIERGYLGTLLRLTLLAPDIVEAIFAGRAAARGTGAAAALGLVPSEMVRAARHVRRRACPRRPPG